MLQTPRCGFFASGKRRHPTAYQSGARQHRPSADPDGSVSEFRGWRASSGSKDANGSRIRRAVAHASFAARAALRAMALVPYLRALWVRLSSLTYEPSAVEVELADKTHVQEERPKPAARARERRLPFPRSRCGLG